MTNQGPCAAKAFHASQMAPPNNVSLQLLYPYLTVASTKGARPTLCDCFRNRARWWHPYAVPVCCARQGLLGVMSGWIRSMRH